MQTKGEMWDVCTLFEDILLRFFLIKKLNVQ